MPGPLTAAALQNLVQGEEGWTPGDAFRDRQPCRARCRSGSEEGRPPILPARRPGSAQQGLGASSMMTMADDGEEEGGGWRWDAASLNAVLSEWVHRC